jgi:UDP-2,3-diacylglucosamine pyrophosphatase LpxH
MVILNGDIIDIWQFSKSYWPKSHMKVVKHLLGLMSKDIPIYYIPGNHDEMLRKFEGFHLGGLQIENKVIITLPDGKKAWCFHGDVFDVTMQHSKWLTKLGAVGYDILILINRLVNFFSEKVFQRGKLSLSKKIKNSVKSAVKFINDFEQTAADIAIDNGYDFVVCGHIHQPDIRTIQNNVGSVVYLNSGDWMENLSALEYVDGHWQLYKYETDSIEPDETDDELQDSKALFDNMLAEFTSMKHKEAHQ